jgi:uncharacterized membrane protein YagU involved in acid resistance
MLSRVAKGAVSGLTATIPRTVVMETAFQQLPIVEQYALPPRQITRRLGRAIDIWHRLSEEERQALSLGAHFSYGAAAGALYAACVPPRFINGWTGIAYGMTVWAGSYLGLLPGLGILRPATDHPRGRNHLMIAAHLVWGAALGSMLKAIEDLPENHTHDMEN